MPDTPATQPTSRYDHGGDSALLVVDVQNDFADPAGSLYVTGAEEVVDGVNAEIAAARAAGATVVLTQDWHPSRTPHFVEDGGVWPPHCIAGTWGAALVERLSTDADLVLRKGTGGEDGYSAFTVADPVSGDTTPTGLLAYLTARGVRRVAVAGIALDVCVKATAVDAVDGGLHTTVLTALTRAVDLAPGDGAAAVTAMADHGATIVEA